ncbi:MAG: CAP domain-containing protein [Halolamina sp.]|uniref:CAP domain-containing protein n=1 Tax=Halolamina sp. TaxID=1940283 RepID=UPI002FC27587
MRLATVAVCLLILSAGCVVEDQGTETATPSTPERIEETADTPKEPVTPSSGNYDIEVVALENLVHKKMNERRKEHGVKPLNRSEKLDAIARYKSWDMAQQDYFAHHDSNGGRYGYLRDRYNANCQYMSQNLNKSTHSGAESHIQKELRDIEEISKRAVNSLMNSTGHRKNILNPDYELQGIGIFVDENGTVFLTQEFCG